MKFTFTCLLAIFTLTHISCGSHSEQKNKKPKKVILVTFTIDDTKQNINNNYQVVFFGKNKILTCQTNKDTLIIPNEHLFADSTYDVKFIFYDTINFLFKNAYKQQLIPDQNMTWEVGVDHKPFNPIGGYMSVEDDTNKLKKISYWGFNLQEYGDGIMFLQKE